MGTHARACRLILRTFQCGLWRCAIPHASRCRVSSPSSGYAAPRLLEVWWDSSWPLPLPSSHGYATSRAIPQRTEFPCADPNEKMLCQCFHVAVAHSLPSHARLPLVSPVLYFTAWPRGCVVQASMLFILFFCRSTLRGECTIVVECLKCLRGKCQLLLFFFATPLFRCSSPVVLSSTTFCLSRARLHGLLDDGVMIRCILLCVVFCKHWW